MYHKNRVIGYLGLWILLNLFACDDPYKISLATQTQADATLIDTFSINTNIVWQDSVSTSDRYITALSPNTDNRNMRMMVGKLTSSCFGNYDFWAMSRIRCTAIAIPDVPTTLDSIAKGLLDVDVDSAIVSLGGLSFYGDTTRLQRILVERILTDIDTNKTYWVDEQPNFATSPLGTINFLPRAVYDSASKNWLIRRPVLRIDELGRELVRKMASKEIQNEATFGNVLKGLRISMTEGNCITTFDTNNCAIILYFRRKQLPTVTVTSTLYFSNPTLSLKNQWASFANLNLGNTFLRNLQKNQPLPTSQTNHQIYLQDGIGIIANIKIPALEGFNLKQPNGERGKYMVNRAEIYFEPVIDDCWQVNQSPPTNIVFFKAATPTDMMSRNNKTINTNLTQDAWVPLPLNGESASNFNPPPLRAEWSANSRTYTAPAFTRFIQDVMDGKASMQNGFFIAAAGFAQNPNTGESNIKLNTSVNRVRLYDSNPIHGNKRMRLRLYVTKF
jgi:hypothetical protein